MSDDKPWINLFDKNSEKGEAELHSAGATVRHRNPFEGIVVPRNEFELSQEFIDKWVKPFYMTHLFEVDDITAKKFSTASKEIDLLIIGQLLGDFNWRTRITAAYFAAINNYQELEDIIGNHLLKSEVCDAGRGYCLALATFATSKSKEYLIRYLEYYLDKKDLWFDQAYAFVALEYFDKASSDRFLGKWEEFVSNKPNWDLKNTRELFLSSMSNLERIRLGNSA